MNIFKLIALLTLSLSLVACGIKGPLTLPEPEQKTPHTEQS